MNQHPSRGARLLSSAAAVTLAVAGVGLVAATPATAATAVVYDSIPDVSPPAYASLGYQATSTSEFGDYVVLGGENRVVTEVTVGLTNWACENWAEGANPCVSTPGSSFTHPITLNLYEVDSSGATPAVGDLIESVTVDQEIPFRPSANAEECGDNRWHSEDTDSCYNGYAFNVTFDGLNAHVGNDVIVSVAYNTQSYGVAPLGVTGPYNSLNVSLANDAASVGTDENLDEMYWNSTYLGRAPGLTIDTGWDSYFGLVMEITADSVPAIDPLTEVTVYERDVKAEETAATYTSWHEGNPNATLDNSVVLVDGLHLGVGDPSTVIKGTDIATPEGIVANTLTRAQLRSLVERAGVHVVSGSVTYQIPVFFGTEAEPQFTTLRSTSLGPGTHSFSQADTWATTRAFGAYGVQDEAPLGELIDALYAEGGVVLGGYGVQADSDAVVATVTWDDTRYTFTQPVIEACTPTIGDEVTNIALGDWDFSQTRAQGTNEFTEDGLRVTTFGEPSSPDQRKAAGYHPIDIALSEIGSVAMDIAPGYTGVRPSLQLGFDADGDGTQDAYLVGEPWAYGGGDWSTTVNGDWADANFWVTGSTSYGVPAGGGYPSLGTLDEYLLANPEARIVSYGYSLGSGVVGDATIRSITVACVTTPFGFELETLAPADVERLSGPDRYATSVAISQESYPGTADTVIIATGADFADALSAAPAAAVADAPLLLTAPLGLPAVVRSELSRLQPSEVIIVGGTGAVSSSVETTIAGLAFGPSVTRISGGDRYETSRAIADEFFESATNVFIATGRDYPDALAAGPAAAALVGPVVLVPGTNTSVDSQTLSLLSDLSVESVFIAGGTTVVRSSIEGQLDALYDVVRLSGGNRYETAVAINEYVFDSEDAVYLATGEGFADALAGGAAAADAGQPLYITPQSCLLSDVLASMNARAASTVYVLGGTAALSTSVENLTVCS